MEIIWPQICQLEPCPPMVFAMVITQLVFSTIKGNNENIYVVPILSGQNNALKENLPSHAYEVYFHMN